MKNKIWHVITALLLCLSLFLSMGNGLAWAGKFQGSMEKCVSEIGRASCRERV